jgi:hypothetical protein
MPIITATFWRMTMFNRHHMILPKQSEPEDSRRRGKHECLVFLIWTTTYWAILSCVFFKPYDCLIEVALFVSSWLAPIIVAISLGQEGLALLLLPLHVYLFFKYWSLLAKTLRAGWKRAFLGILLHMLGGYILLAAYRVHAPRPDFGFLIALVTSMSMLVFLVCSTVLHTMFFANKKQ